MKHDPDRKGGFYWIRFEGEVIVAEWDDQIRSWKVPGSDGFYNDAEVCELLSGRLKCEGTKKSNTPTVA